MPRYISRPQSPTSWHEYMPEITASDAQYREPIVESVGPVPTGLLDKHGHQIYRMPEPVGFIHHDDTSD